LGFTCIAKKERKKEEKEKGGTPKKERENNLCEGKPFRLWVL
jgi:hypothetical protein